MIGKVKKWLGIEGTKLELILPEEWSISGKSLPGRVRLFSKNAQVVTSVKLVLIERYVRGRGKEKRSDEYLLGETTIHRRIEVPAEGSTELKFEIPFSIIQSDMDKLEDRNLLSRKFVKAAKWLEGVQSQYRVEAEATVEGVALNPFERKEVRLV
ncbi:MAG: sporulation protein [Saprospirales bacterium]|nr:sporulation protein [Saprospirales bacterium]MBK8493287.1 sporulation protein [Saprospirales bacterium]